jgi:cell division protease FtsH
MVNQLLTEMDGFRKEQMVLIVGTTNFVESLDPAFLRPGRFEYQIEIPYPEWEDRRAIIELYNQKFETGLNKEQIEKLAGWTGRRTELGTPYTGDHLSALLKDLKRYLLNNNTEVQDNVIAEWLSGKVEEAKLSDEEEKVVAFHESGHAMAFYLFARQDEITRITLESGGNDSLGFVESMDQKVNHFYTESKLKSEIGISLGGYAAEQVVYGEVSTGAWQDLRKATAVATDMASLYGMAGTPREFSGRDNQPDPYFLPAISPHIDRIINEVYSQVRAFLEKNAAILRKLVTELQQKRTLNREQVEEIVNKDILKK